MPRFVLLWHHCPPHLEKPSHWDFMLEHRGVLRTWELRKLPLAWAKLLGETSPAEIAAGATVSAHPLPDHRLAYLEFEGPLSGDRGTVQCCDRGTYRLLRRGEPTLRILLAGTLLRGKVDLEQQEQSWLLAPEADRFC